MYKKTQTKIITLLRWSEKYTKTDMLYFASNGLWVLLGQITVQAAAFFTTIILANTLNKDTLGQYRFITTIIPIIALFTLPSLGRALARSAAKDHKIDWAHLLRIKIYSGTVSIFIAIIISIYYFTHGNIILTKIYGIIAIFIIFYDLFLLYNYYLQGIRDFKHASAYLGYTRIVQALLVTITAITTHNILLILISFFIGFIIPQYILYKYTLRVHVTKPKHSVEKNLLQYSLHLTSVHGIVLLTSNFDKLFTWHYLGLEQFAIYTIALILPLNILSLFNFIPQIYLPSISTLKLNVSTRKKIMKQVFFVLIILSSISLVYILISPWLLLLLFPAYIKSIPATIILAALIPILPINTLLSQIFQIHNLLKYIIILRLILVLMFTSIFFFITHHVSPTLAPAIAFVAGEFTILIFGLAFLRYANLLAK